MNLIALLSEPNLAFALGFLVAGIMINTIWIIQWMRHNDD